MNSNKKIITIKHEVIGNDIFISCEEFPQKVVIDMQNKKVRNLRTFFNQMVINSFKNNIQYTVMYDDGCIAIFREISENILILFNDMLDSYIKIFAVEKQ